MDGDDGDGDHHRHHHHNSFIPLIPSLLKLPVSTWPSFN